MKLLARKKSYGLLGPSADNHIRSPRGLEKDCTPANNREAQQALQIQCPDRRDVMRTIQKRKESIPILEMTVVQGCHREGRIA